MPEVTLYCCACQTPTQHRIQSTVVDLRSKGRLLRGELPALALECRTCEWVEVLAIQPLPSTQQQQREAGQE